MNARQARAEIVKRYRRATYCYATPCVLLLLGFVLWPEVSIAGLYLLVPAGVAGLCFTGQGMRLAAAYDDREKKSVGGANVLLGVLLLVVGLLVLMLVASHL